MLYSRSGRCVVHILIVGGVWWCACNAPNTIQSQLCICDEDLVIPMSYPTTLKLVCNRNDGGKFNTNVNKVNPDDVWNVDDGKQVGFLRNNIYEQNRSLVLRFFF